MDYKMADRLIEFRKKKGYSQEDLAERLNVSRQAVSKWERSESLPDTENLIALSRLYNVTLDEIVNGEKTSSTNCAYENHTNIIIPINQRKVLKIISFIFAGLGILFVILGTGFFLGFAVPETRDLKLAQNEHIEPINAEVTRIERTGTSIANEPMYKIVYEWSNEFSNGKGKSNPVYSKSEADAMVGQTVSVRVDGNRVVMVDYQRSILSTLGFIFLGVFGGLGTLFILAFVLITILNKKPKSKD